MELGGHAFTKPGAAAASVLMFFVLLAFPSSSRGDVYYYRDSQGVFHFTNVPGPDTEPFMIDSMKPTPPRAEAAAPRAGIGKASPYDQIIHEVSEHYEVEPALVKAVIRVESGFDRMAVSPRGARGLMQLMPRTARLYGAANLHDPRENIRAGVRHLRRLFDRYAGNLSHVLAAYNAGDGPVQRYRGIPPYPETRRFVTRVLRFFDEYRRQDQLAAGTYATRF